MNAVVLTVKSCYVASTKYPRQMAELAEGLSIEKQKPIVVWKMKVRFLNYLKTKPCGGKS